MKKFKEFQLLMLIFSLLCIHISAFAINKDSLVDIIEHGEAAQKTSAFYRLGATIRDENISKIYFDSAQYYYTLNPNDTDLMLMLGFKGMSLTKFSRYDEAIDLCKQSYKMAGRIKKQKDKAAMLNYISNVYNNQHEYDSAIVYLQMAIKEFNILREQGTEDDAFCVKKLAYCKYNMGKQLFRQGNYNLAVEYMYDGLRNYDEINDLSGKANIHNNLGNIYLFNGDYDRAYIELSQCIKYAKIVNNDAVLNVAYSNLGSIFLTKKEYDSALYYFDMTLAIKLKQPETEISVAGLYNNKGLVYKHLQQFDTALSYFEKALVLQKKVNYQIGLANTKANIGLAYVAMGKPQMGKQYLLEALSYTEGNKMGETTKEIYLGLYTIYDDKKEFKKALEYYQLYVLYKDSINSIEVTKKINEYKEIFEAEKKDLEIDKLQQEAKVKDLEREKQKAEIKKQRLVAAAMGLLAILLLVLVFVIQRYFKLRQKAIKEQANRNEEINQQKIVDLVKGQEVDSINSYMEGQEKERSRIAGELHDRLGSLLSTVKLHFSSIESSIKKDEETEENFGYALSLLDSSVEEVRSISHNLSKGILTEFGLAVAVESLKDAINSAGKIQLNYYRVGPQFHLMPDVEIELFRVIQELITNAIKHSHSKDIFVQLISDEDGLTVMVEDHGVGFDINNMKSNGIGLINLKKRVENIGGEYHLESAPKNGTSVIIEVKNRMS